MDMLKIRTEEIIERFETLSEGAIYTEIIDDIDSLKKYAWEIRERANPLDRRRAMNLLDLFENKVSKYLENAEFVI